MRSASTTRGFTLVELLTAMLILSILGLMSYRGLGTVLDTREHVQHETEKWRRVAAFFDRFERDAALAAPRTIRTATGIAPAWNARPGGTSQPQIEFSRFASAADADIARRVAYRLNDQGQIELWLWSALDTAPGTAPVLYPLLGGVSRFDVQYLDARQNWTSVWPVDGAGSMLPRAIRLQVMLASGETIVRVFALTS